MAASAPSVRSGRSARTPWSAKGQRFPEVSLELTQRLRGCFQLRGAVGAAFRAEWDLCQTERAILIAGRCRWIEAGNLVCQQEHRGSDDDEKDYPGGRETRAEN